MAQEGAAKGPTAGKAQDVDAIGDLFKFIVFVAVGLGLILYLQVLRNRRYWVLMETGLGVVSLLTLPMASLAIDYYQSTGANPLAIYLFRLMALAKVSQSAVVFLTRNSRDPTVAIAVSVTQILTRVAMIMCAIHGIFYDKTINQSALRMDVVVTTLLIIGDAFQLSKLTTREGSLTIGDPISFHMSIDGILKFMLASWVFGFPEMFLKVLLPGVEPNGGQIALTQVFGCFVFGLAVLSFASLCFKDHEDAINVLKAKLILYVPALLFGAINYFVDADYRSPGYILAGVGSMKLLTVNAGYAVWAYEKEKIY